jgi:hypothetical protein
MPGVRVFPPACCWSPAQSTPALEYNRAPLTLGIRWSHHFTARGSNFELAEGIRERNTSYPFMPG